MLFVLLACSSAPQVTPHAGPVDIVGVVHGWDGSGDVAVEACGLGALVEPDGAFAMHLKTVCDVRVVWESAEARARGPWVPVAAVGPVVWVDLKMPDRLKPLSADELREKDAFIRSAIDQLHGGEPAAGEAAGQAVW